MFVVTKVKKALKYANHSIHLATHPQQRVLESLNEVALDMYFNEELLRSLKEINPKNVKGGKEGFLIPIGIHRNNTTEANAFLGCLEVNLFNYLDRAYTESNSLFDRQESKRLSLIYHIEDLVTFASRNFRESAKIEFFAS